MPGAELKWLLLAAATIAIAAFVYAFNRLITARNACRNARASIDVQLTRRHDLVPNLVRAVAGYAAHEREVLRIVTDARAEALAALGAAASANAEQRLDGALGAL